MYDEAFQEMSEIVVQKEILQSDTVLHLYLLQLNPEHLKAGRKDIFDALTEEDISCNLHYIPVCYFPYYQKLGYPKGFCPHEEALFISTCSQFRCILACLMKMFRK